MKARVVSEQTPVVMTIGNEEVMIIKDDTSKKLPQGKEAAIEAEVRAARERAMVPLETRMLQFRGLLEEKQVSAFSSWEKELSKIVFDPRYLLLTRKEKKAKAKERKENFIELCKEVGVTPKSSWSEFSREQAKDERFKAIEKSRDRETHFNDYVSELKKKEKDKKDEKRKEKDKKRAERSRSRSSGRGKKKKRSRSR